MLRRNWLVIFTVLTVINIIVFIYRDHFAWRPHSTYSDLYSTCDEGCLSKWKRFVSEYPAPDKTEGKKILASIISSGNASSYSKIFEIGNFLHKRFSGQMGRPSPQIGNAAPLEQYKLLCSSDSLKLWCGNFAIMLNFFCWTEDIPCRMVEIMKPGDHHVLNECYIHEDKRWVMVDLTNDQLFVQDAQNKFLDLVEFRDSVRHPGYLLAWTASDTALEQKQVDRSASFIQSYYNTDYPLYYYYQVNPKNIYSPTEKVRRYVLPGSWYEIYNEHRSSNLLFYLKDFLLAAWVVSLFLLYNPIRNSKPII